MPLFFGLTVGYASLHSLSYSCKYICYFCGVITLLRSKTDIWGIALKETLIMGNSLKKQKEASLAANNTKKSKGERLGWKSISEYKTVSLKEIVGNGNRVNETNIPVNTSIRLVP